MDIEQLLNFLYPRKIDLGDYGKSGIGFIFPNGYIFLNRSTPEEEQIKTILHEIFHLDEKFIDYTKDICTGISQRDEKIESRIEKLAQKTYTERPDIVAVVRERLKCTYAHPLNSHMF